LKDLAVPQVKSFQRHCFAITLPKDRREATVLMTELFNVAATTIIASWPLPGIMIL